MCSKNPSTLKVTSGYFLTRHPEWKGSCDYAKNTRNCAKIERESRPFSHEITPKSR